MAYQLRKSYLHEQTGKKKNNVNTKVKIIQCCTVYLPRQKMFMKCLKGIVYLKMNAVSTFTHPQEKKRKKFRVQKTLNPTDFHCIDKRNSPQKKVCHTGLKRHEGKKAFRLRMNHIHDSSQYGRH